MHSEEPSDHRLVRQMSLRDLVLAQVLTVVGSSWVGIAAGLGHAQTLVWLIAMSAFYLPMAAVVYYLNREMPLEGGLYVWARKNFGDTIGFLTAWNIWTYALSSIATILFQIPSEFAFLVGPRAAWIPDNHSVVISAMFILTALLGLTAWRGLSLGKWIHNLSGAAMMAAFALLIVAPLWAWAHGTPVHFTPLELHLPKTDLTSLGLIGNILLASAGLEYIAIMAGETHSPAKLVGRSVIFASPIVVLMFTLGTASVLAFHEHTGAAINYIAPIPQTLRLAFGDSGVGTFVARLVILLLMIRIFGAASFLFTGVTRLPMTAGWDHLIPAWFSRLGRYRTPVNSILVSSAIVAGLIVLASVGTHAAEAFALLNNASNELYGIAYLAMFAIPVLGTVALRKTIPLWVKMLCVIGFLAVVVSCVFSTYPFVDVPNPGVFATKIIFTIVLTNLLGYGFLKLRRNNRA